MAKHITMIQTMTATTQDRQMKLLLVSMLGLFCAYS
jgi:hypothetical protein